MKRVLAIAILSLMIATPLAAQDQPVARAAVLWIVRCPHCQEVIDEILPSLTHRLDAQCETSAW